MTASTNLPYWVVASRVGCVADTLWSVRIKCCFLQKESNAQKLEQLEQSLPNDSPEAVTSQARKT